MKLAETVTFGAGQLERAAHLRGDEAALAELSHTAGFLPIWRGKALVENNKPTGVAKICLLDSQHPIITHFQNATPENTVFLGYDTTGRAIMTFDMSDWIPEIDTLEGQIFLDETIQFHPQAPANAGFQELRALLTAFSPEEAEIAASARAILEWHRSHGFCANCGAQSQMSQAGWQRDCPKCERPHFPRTDPVVIMLVTRNNSVLLGRSPGWPEGMYSLLAGFMEPGETIEAATRREVLEETGVRIGDVGYLASQPWPFPSSLMIGTHAEALSDEITVDPHELEDALWLNREEVLAVQAGERTDIFPARPGSIAHFLVRNWLADRLD